MLMKWIQALGMSLLLMVSAHADLTIEITQGSEGALPIAIVPFQQPVTGAPAQNVDQIVTSDLARSGRFHHCPLPICCLARFSLIRLIFVIGVR